MREVGQKDPYRHTSDLGMDTGYCSCLAVADADSTEDQTVADNWLKVEIDPVLPCYKVRQNYDWPVQWEDFYEVQDPEKQAQSVVQGRDCKNS